MTNNELLTVGEFRQLVSDTNRVLDKIGIPPVKASEIQVSHDPIFSHYLPQEYPPIVLNKMSVATLAHEAYHKHARESALTPGELDALNNYRIGLVDKVRKEIVARHTQVEEYLRKIHKSTGDFTRGYCYKPFDEVYIVPCMEGCGGDILDEPPHHIKTYDDRFPTIMLSSSHYHTVNGNNWEQVPDASKFINLTHFVDLFTPEEGYFIGALCYHPDDLEKQPRRVGRNEINDGAFVDVVDKFYSRKGRLTYLGFSADEGPAHLISEWLKGRDMDDYERLISSVGDGIRASFRFSRSGKGLAEIVVGNYERLRRSEVSVEGAIAQTANIDNFLQLIE